MEQQLVPFMSGGLRPLLPPQQYSNLMGQLELVFQQYRNGTVSEGQLQLMYAYVQAAVDGREVARVVSTLTNRLSMLSQG
jgi:hypothetical protein